MEEEFFLAKNGQKSCSKNGLPLHSNYNPEKEAQRFAESIEAALAPLYVVVTGPALSYCAPFLRQKFPKAKLVAVHYSEAFAEADRLWDFSFTANAEASLQNRLFSLIGEEDSGATLFLSWKASEAAYPEEFKCAWNEIKGFVAMARDVLATRMYFNKRWLKNALRFCLYSNNLHSLREEATNLPLVLAASGPSLGKLLPTLRKNRGKYFLLAVSSALLPLLTAELIPDAVVSTDGGFWAKEHLKSLPAFAEKPIPVFAAAEGAFPTRVLEQNPVVPLCYGDAPEALLLKASGIAALPALRNGTVSGTAASLALNLSTNSVFCAGLDLAPASGFQHTQPNEQERRNSQSDRRTATLATRNGIGEMSSGSLAVYREWFSQQPKSFSSRVFRVRHESDSYKFGLANIKELNQLEFEPALLKASPKKPRRLAFERQDAPPQAERNKLLRSYIEEIRQKTEEAFLGQTPASDLPPELSLWLKNVALGDFILAERGGKPMSSEMHEKARKVFDELQGTVASHGRGLNAF